MSIAFTEYVNITSGVGGNTAVGTRQLIGRIFTTNPLLPTQTIMEFVDAPSVGAYFGLTSEEYKRAAFYFGWVSKNITKPQKISFSRWASAATAPTLISALAGSGVADTTLGDYTSITNGDFTLILGGVTNHITGMNFSGCGSLSAVAAVVQTAIRTQTGSMWTAATVSFTASANGLPGYFELIGGTTGPGSIAITAGGTTDVAGLLGWLTGAILSPGVAIETLTQTLTNSAGTSNNFGSFAFVGGSSFTQSQQVEIATWNSTMNNMFMNSVCVTAANASAFSAALMALPGTALTLKGVSGEYHEMMPMMILAATDYTQPNAVQNYMYQQFALTPTVTDTTTARAYNALRVNYYGQTQESGQLLAFYQRGTLMGGATAPTDQNTYANEMWLKAAAESAFGSLLISAPKISANASGATQVLSTIQSVANQGKTNGTISPGKDFDSNQILYITEISADPNAWRQVENIGYWANCVLQSYVTSDSRTEWMAVYKLIYGKDDDVRLIQGSHILI